MADNLVSQPPLNVPMIDATNGLTSKAWSNWFRDLYRRTSYKGGNAIDENKAETDADLLLITASLEDTVIQVNTNIQDIGNNETAIDLNASNLEDHVALESAHGSNGDIVGFEDLANEVSQGLVKRMTVLADAISSNAGIVVADASAAPSTYSQTHSQELVDLSNANKAAINTLVADFNNAVTVLNNLIARSKASGQMTT